MADRSYSAIADGSDRVIAIYADTGVLVTAWKVPHGSSVISVTPSGDTASVVVEDSSGNRKGIIMKLPSLSQIRSFPVASASKFRATSSGSSPKAGSTGSSSKNTSAYTPRTESSGPPLVLDDDENSLKSLLTLSGFFSLFTLLIRAGNTMKRFGPNGSSVGQGLTKRDFKVLGLLLIIVFLWATCTGDNPQPRQQQPRQYQKPKPVVQRQVQPSPIKVPRTDTVVDTKNLAERMANRNRKAMGDALSDNPNDNTPPNFPEDLPRGFKRVYINDPDGYQNMRTEPSGQAQVVAQLPNNEVIYVEDSDTTWARALRPRDGTMGFVYRERLGEFAFPVSRGR